MKLVKANKKENLEKSVKKIVIDDENNDKDVIEGTEALVVKWLKKYNFSKFYNLNINKKKTYRLMNL